jgi:hypothetical protein
MSTKGGGSVRTGRAAVLIADVESEEQVAGVEP